ncbi:hypothetical protein AgCh_004538 [Apium graveolens]
MASLVYEQSLAKLGQLKRARIRREWSFFFDCITKAFGNKCSNFDAIPIMSQHIGYAIINQTHFDFATAVIDYKNNSVQCYDEKDVKHDYFSHEKSDDSDVYSDNGKSYDVINSTIFDDSFVLYDNRH